MSESAIAALLVAHGRLDAVSEVSWLFDWDAWPVDLGKLDEARAEAPRRADGYREAAAAALRAVARGSGLGSAANQYPETISPLVRPPLALIAIVTSNPGAGRQSTATSVVAW